MLHCLLCYCDDLVVENAALGNQSVDCWQQDGVMNDLDPLSKMKSGSASAVFLHHVDGAMEVNHCDYDLASRDIAIDDRHACPGGYDHLDLDLARVSRRVYFYVLNHDLALDHDPHRTA